MPLYESVFIVRQDASSQQVEGLAEDFSKIVKDLGGSVPKTEHWGLRNLAYRIKKNRKGHYVLFNIDAPYDAVAEMERNMRLNEDVLRHMTLRVDALEEGPSIVMRVKAGRDEGSRREASREARDHDRASADAKPKVGEARETQEGRGDGDEASAAAGENEA